jgi:hypothetical protein
VHEDEIGGARWRIRLVAAAGVALLAVTIAVLVFPIAVVVFGGFALLGGSFGLGVSLLAWSAAVSAGIGVVSSAGVFAWSLLRAEQRALEFVRAWPHPGSPPVPPPRMPPRAYERADRLIRGLAIAAGVLPPAFGEFDETSVLLAPFALLLTPVVVGGMLLRAAALRARARLADGLAVRYSRNPVALAHALRRILEDPGEVRRGDPGNAHLWLEYPHTRVSRWLLGTHRILPRRVERLDRVARIG